MLRILLLLSVTAGAILASGCGHNDDHKGRREISIDVRGGDGGSGGED